MSSFTPDRSAALGGPAWLRARRAAAADRFAAGELPTHEDEIWRYTPIKKLELDRFGPPASPVLGAPDDLTGRSTRPERGGEWVGGVEAAATVVIVDGRLVSSDVSAAGVTVSVAGDDAPGLLEVPDRNALDDLHDAFVGDVVVVRIADGAVVEQPIVVMQVAGDGASFPHVVVAAGAQSEATILDVWTGGGGESYVSPIVEVRTGAAANVRYVGVQDLGTGTWSNAHLVLHPARDATTKAWFAALGGSFARLYATAQLEEQAGTAEIAGVYFGEGDQVLDFRSVQDHQATRSVSNLLLKGAVVDDAHAIYTGMIKVHEGAKATESFLANRNLVLSAGAHVDSVPNLEIINENDIKSCGHAAATGPVDEEHLFYLESRGVPTDVAERLIVFGFFDDVVRGIPIPALHEPLRAAITRKLSHV